MNSQISLNLIKNWQELCHSIIFIDIAPLLLENRIISVNEYQQFVSKPETARMESLLLLLLKRDEDVLLKFSNLLEKDYNWLAEKLMEGYIKEEGRDETDASPISRLNCAKDIDTPTEDEESSHLSHRNLNSLNRRNLNNSLNNKNRKLVKRKILDCRMKNRLKTKVNSSDNETIMSSSTELVKPVLNEEVTDEVIKIIRRTSIVSRNWTTLAHSLGLTDRINDIRYKVILHGEDLSMCVAYLIKDWIEIFPKDAKLSKLIEVLRSEDLNGVADKLTNILFGQPLTKAA